MGSSNVFQRVLLNASLTDPGLLSYSIPLSQREDSAGNPGLEAFREKTGAFLKWNYWQKEKGDYWSNSSPLAGTKTRP